jgi:uncharacterized protein (DUF1778 family)
MPKPKTPKTERVELRVSPAVREALELASTLTGLSLGDLAYEGAKAAIERHEHMVLRDADRDAFLLSMRNPPKPTARLKEAFREHAARVSHTDGDKGK